MPDIKNLVDELVRIYDDSKDPSVPNINDIQTEVETVRDAKFYLNGYLEGYQNATYQTMRALVLNGFYDPADEKKETKDA